ncbi:FecR family protein [Mucilaginibacter mallensis]|uniref:FecR family protein n=1 Tax=Mucilaginibacter mallensis TaxID=652787 RepID=A0A1H2BE28_MUCMA|nr:FecR domain-containing protein [Mucilaginibacter mallensis]SDT56404.1 FecR family protein [Mucilaginibacter mallensis]
MLAKELLKKYLEGNCTEEEKAIVETWYVQHRVKTQKALTDAEQTRDIHQIINYLDTRVPGARKVQLWPRIAAAATILLFLSVSGYFLLHKQAGQQLVQNHPYDIAPGGNKAILTSHGRKIILDNAKNGLIATNGSVAVNKKADGLISYDASQASNTNITMVYDTITIPRGGQYQLKMSDGSKVWLNAATILRYPEKFAGKERKIELISGEAYMEVVHNKAMPFKVLVKGQVIEDLGTHFNINAYDDEELIKTTLLEGSVKVNTGGQAFLLKPGQQAQVNATTHLVSVHNVDTEDEIAWKNGLFTFHNASIQTVLRQLARWYDVKIEYEGQIPDRMFSGDIYRNTTALQALDLLSFTKVHFRIEKGADGHSEKKIVVTP